MCCSAIAGAGASADHLPLGAVRTAAHGGPRGNHPWVTANKVFTTRRSSTTNAFDKVRNAKQFVPFMAQLKPVWELYERQMR